MNIHITSFISFYYLTRQKTANKFNRTKETFELGMLIVKSKLAGQNS